MKLKPSDIWCACERAKVPFHDRNRIVHKYMRTGKLPYKVEKVLKEMKE